MARLDDGDRRVFAQRAHHTQLFGDGQPELLDRQPRRAPERVEAVAAGVEHRRELLVVGDRDRAVEVLGAEALLDRSQIALSAAATC